MFLCLIGMWPVSVQLRQGSGGNPVGDEGTPRVGRGQIRPSGLRISGSQSTENTFKFPHFIKS